MSRPCGPATGAVLAVAALLAAAPAASGATLFDGRVAASDAQERRCHARLTRGDGVVRRTVTVAQGSLVRARLSAPGGDWDLGLFDRRSGRSIGGSAAFGSRELAEGFAAPGAIVVQACRRSGTSRVARLRVGAFALPPATGDQQRRTVSLVQVSTPTAVAKTRLQRLGLDFSEEAGPTSIGVVLYGEQDHAKLRSAGFTYKVEIADLVARQARNRLSDARFALRTRRSSLPSGRDDYRRLPDFEADMKALVERRPDLVRPIVLPHPSLEGRRIQGIEITKDVAQTDGKPVYLQLGVHHAREWPAAEMPMELAVDLVESYGSDRRLTDLVDRVRTIIVPIVNPDGFNLSREAPVDLQALGSTAPLTRALFDVIGQTAVYDALGANAGLVDQVGGNPGGTAAILLDANTDNFAYKRRNCRVADGQVPAPGECGLGANRTLGSDPNRNYGGFWGGPGASTSPDADDYRGAAPFSEPEVENVRDLVSAQQVTTLITNHTYSNLVLRPPGLAAEGATPDEEIYKALGDAMGRATAYTSQYSYGLYDTTGTTEDWSYYQTGGLGFTFEIGPHEFHPPFEQTIAEYEGNPPTPIDGVGRPQKEGGLREAYLLAMENAANPARHAVLTGRTAPGTRLEVGRSGMYMTSPVIGADGTTADPIALSDSVGSSIIVPPDGAFEWHLNPSTRPYARKDRRTFLPADAPASREELSGRPLPPTNLFPIEIAEGDLPFLRAQIAGAGEADDYDLYLYRGESPLGDEVASSATPSNREQFTVRGLPPGRYTLEVRNFSATGDWTGAIERYADGRAVGTPPAVEAWKLTCTDASGAVTGTENVTIDRGQRIDLGTICGAGVAGASQVATRDGRLLARSPQRRGLQLSLATRRVKLGTLRRSGMRLSARCSSRCATTVALRVTNATARRYGITRRRSSRPVTIGRVRLNRMSAGKSRQARVRLTRTAARKLRNARRVSFTMTASARSLTGQRRAATLRFTLRR